MNPIELVLLFAVAAGVIHVTRFWPRLACGIILLSTAALVLGIARASATSLEILGVSLTVEPAARDYLAVGLVLTGALALATIFRRDRISVGFLFWSWVPWFIALAVNDFVVAVFAWAIGFVAAVFAMKPRRYHRASGAAYFLVVIVIATASLLLANRFAVLYPLTPDRTFLVQFVVLFLCWGFGLAFALLPFQFWVGPMTDDAPLPTAAAVLALGQPIGLVLLFRFLNQNLWLGEKSNIFELMALGGLVATIVGGLMAAVERRGGRLLGYAAVFTFGFALLDLSRASQEGLAYSSLEIMSRAIGLSVLACAATIGREVEHHAARRVAQAAAVLAGFSLVGLRLGVGLSERWNAMLQLAGTDQRLFPILILAHMGLLVGVIRFTGRWFEEAKEEAEPEPEITVPAERGPAFQREKIPLPSGESGRVSLVIDEGRGNGRDSSQAVDVTGPALKERVAEPDDRGAPATLKDSAGREKEGGEEKGSSPEDYVFEEHVREIVKTIVERTRPYLHRAARSLPAGTMGLLVLIWSSWRVWVSITLLIALIGALLAVGLVPGAWFDRAVASLGQPPIVQ